MIVCLLASVVLAVVSAAPTDYSYAEMQNGGVKKKDGPSKWGELRSDGKELKYPLCRGTTRQSPINFLACDTETNINQQQQDSLTPLDFFSGNARVRFFTSVNDGNNVWFQLPPTGTNNPPATIAARPTLRPPTGSTLYELDRIMFHAPSEHTFASSNRDGEIHLVYVRVGGSSDAADRDADSTVIVAVTLLVSAGRLVGWNEALSPLLAALAPPANESDDRPRTVAVNHTMPGSPTIDVTRLLPAGRSYTTYRGSLTYPPCVENVRWFVFHDAVTLSGYQLAQLVDVLGPARELPRIAFQPAGNFRPVQANTMPRAIFFDVAATDTARTTPSPWPLPFGATSADDELQTRNMSIASVVIGGVAIVLGAAASAHMMIRRSGSGVEEVVPSAPPTSSVSATTLQDESKTAGAATPAASTAGAPAPGALVESSSAAKYRAP